MQIQNVFWGNDWFQKLIEVMLHWLSLWIIIIIIKLGIACIYSTGLGGLSYFCCKLNEIYSVNCPTDKCVKIDDWLELVVSLLWNVLYVSRYQSWSLVTMGYSPLRPCPVSYASTTRMAASFWRHLITQGGSMLTLASSLTQLMAVS